MPNKNTFLKIIDYYLTKYPTIDHVGEKVNKTCCIITFRSINSSINSLNRILLKISLIPSFRDKILIIYKILL
jgi:hypothetical protein